jgi:uncharacterized protein (DUF983 family)
MTRSRSRLQPVMRAIWLRCPACGRGPLFHGLFTMVPECSACGYSSKREPGFYPGSININYGVTVIFTGRLPRRAAVSTLRPSAVGARATISKPTSASQPPISAAE